MSELELEIVLVDPKDFAVRAVSGCAAKRFGFPPDSIIGHSILEFLAPEARADATSALEAIGSGAIDFYRASRPLQSPEASNRPGTVWVRGVQFGDEHLAFVAYGDDRSSGNPLVDRLVQDPQTMAIGILDAECKIVTVSSEITDLLGVAPHDVIGLRLISTVAQQDVQRLLDASAQMTAERSVSLGVRMRDSTGGWRPVCCVLASLVGSATRLFLLIEESDQSPDQASDRLAVLEDHLLRIAAEVEASGILERFGDVPSVAGLPQMGSLTVRQWEVLSRLLRGERVPTIAEEMFISQSTVRNHLSAIFDRFGVGSQNELLKLLKNRSGQPA